MVQRRFRVSSLLLTAAFAAAGVGFTATHARAAMTPIGVSGFNQDSVVENTYIYSAAAVPANIALWLSPNSGTTGPHNTFYEAGLNGSPAGSGLPVSHLLTSTYDGSTVFQFQHYTNTNNDLLLTFANTANNGAPLGSNGASGTLTLSTPAAYSSLAVLANSTDGNAALADAVTLNFANGVTATTDISTPDWFDNTASGTTPGGNSYGTATGGLGRVALSGGGYSGTPNDPVLTQTTINLANLGGVNYTGDTLDSLTFSAPAFPVGTDIWAVSGAATPAIPEPSTLAAVALGCLGMMGLRRKRRTA